MPLFLSVMGEDFSVVTPLLMVFSGNGSVTNGESVCIAMNIRDDDIYEETQVFYIEIVAVSPLSAAVIATPSSAAKSIQDNQGGFSPGFHT